MIRSLMSEITNIKEFISAVKSAKTDEEAHRISDAADKLINQAFPDDQWLDALCICLSNPKEEIVDAAETIVRSDCINWKKIPDGVNKVLDQLLKKPADLRDLESGKRDDDLYAICKQYQDVAERIIEKTKSVNLPKKVSEKCYELVNRAIKTEESYYSASASKFLKLIDWKNMPDQKKEQLIKIIRDMYFSDTWHQYEEKSTFLISTIDEVLEEVLMEIRPGSNSQNAIKYAYELFCWLEEKDFTKDRGGLNLYGQAYYRIISDLLYANCSSGPGFTYFSDFVPHLIEWTLQGEDLDQGAKQIQERCYEIINFIIDSRPEIVEKHINSLINLYLTRKQISIIAGLKKQYELNDKVRPTIQKHIKSFLDVFEKVEENQQIIIMRLMELISQRAPVDLQNEISRLEKQIGHKSADSVTVLGNITKAQPESMQGRGNDYYDKVRKTKPTLINNITDQIFKYLIEVNEKEAERIVNLEQKEAEKQKHPKELTDLILFQWQQLVHIHPGPLKKRKNYIEKLSKSPQTAVSAQYILDFLEGRTPAPQSLNDSFRKQERSNQKVAPVYLSYQWSHQKQVELLKRHLEKYGFACYMDTSSSGDFREEIETAIEGCQVYIPCISYNFISSGNCIKQVNCAYSYDKIFMPLLFEEMDWPPQGSVKRILTEKPYIRFYANEGEKPTDRRFWSPEKFEELKNQIGEIVQSDPELRIRANKPDSGRKRHSADSNGQRPIRTALRRHSSEKPRKNVRFRDEKRESANRKHANVVLSCSPDKLYEMRNLERQLREYGYSTKVVAYTEGIASSYNSDTVICAMTLRYGQAKTVAQELNAISREGTPILPLMLDKLHYPPPVMLGVAKRPVPIDCTKMKSRSEWEDSPELDQVLARLQSTIPNVKPTRPIKRERSLSNIPLGRNHITIQKAVPLEPLAREASEITIRVRPPTPQKDGSSHIPLPSRELDIDIDDGDSYDEFDDDLETDDTDDDYLESSDSDVKVAKQMQNDNKLPQLQNGHNRQINRSNPPRQPPRNQQRSPVEAVKREPPRVPPKVMQNGQNRQQQNNQRKPYFDLDGPKLPSVYRKKFVSTH